MPTTGINIIAKRQFQNQDNIIDRSPVSVDVEIIKVQVQGTTGLFSNQTDATAYTAASLYGYETPTMNPPIKSKAIIKFDPSRTFLKNVGIFYDAASGTLPIVAFFKSSDNVQRGDTIKTTTIDSDTAFNEQFQVLDVYSKGANQSVGKVYHLAPIR